MTIDSDNLDSASISESVKLPLVDDEQAEISNLRALLESEKQRRIKVNHDMMDLRTKIEQEMRNLELTISQQQEEIDALRSTIDIQAEEISISNDLIKEKETAMTALQHSVDELTFQRDCLVGDIEELQSQIKVNESAGVQLRKSLKLSKDLKASLTEMEENHKSLTRGLRDLYVFTVDNAPEGVSISRPSNETDLSSSSFLLSSINSALISSFSNISSLASALNESRKASDISSSVKENESGAIINSLVVRVHELEQELRKKEDELDSLRQKDGQLGRKLELESSELRNMTEKYMRSLERIEEVDHELATSKELLKMSNDKLALSESRVRVFEEQKIQSEATINHLTSVSQDWDSQKSALEMKISQLESSQSSSKELIITLESKLATLQQEKDSISTSLEVLLSQKQELEEEQSALASHCDTLELSISNMSAELSSALSRVDLSEEALLKSKAEAAILFGDQERTMKRYREENDELSGLLAETSNAVVLLDQDLTALKTNYSNTLDNLKKSEVEVLRLRGLVAALKESNDRLAAEVFQRSPDSLKHTSSHPITDSKNSDSSDFHISLSHKAMERSESSIFKELEAIIAGVTGTSTASSPVPSAVESPSVNSSSIMNKSTSTILDGPIARTQQLLDEISMTISAAKSGELDTSSASLKSKSGTSMSSATSTNEARGKSSLEGDHKHTDKVTNLKVSGSGNANFSSSNVIGTIDLVSDAPLEPRSSYTPTLVATRLSANEVSPSAREAVLERARQRAQSRRLSRSMTTQMDNVAPILGRHEALNRILSLPSGVASSLAASGPISTTGTPPSVNIVNSHPPALGGGLSMSMIASNTAPLGFSKVSSPSLNQLNGTATGIMSPTRASVAAAMAEVAAADAERRRRTIASFVRPLPSNHVSTSHPIPVPVQDKMQEGGIEKKSNLATMSSVSFGSSTQGTGSSGNTHQKEHSQVSVSRETEPFSLENTFPPVSSKVVLPNLQLMKGGKPASAELVQLEMETQMRRLAESQVLELQRQLESLNAS